MATIGNLAITLAEWSKRMDDNYKVANIIEILSQTNEILDDMLVMEGNLPTGHKTTIRTGLPQATWRLLNAGVPNAAPQAAAQPADPDAEFIGNVADQHMRNRNML